MECQLEKPCAATANRQTAPSGNHARNQDLYQLDGNFEDVSNGFDES